ncbi:peptide ABC transporter permease [Vibrio cholerae]|nr:peptide ABC transporter permease [Vibrio cholerae]
MQGDLGTSYFFKRPALEVIFDKLVATLERALGNARSTELGIHQVCASQRFATQQNLLPTCAEKHHVAGIDRGWGADWYYGGLHHFD